VLLVLGRKPATPHKLRSVKFLYWPWKAGFTTFWKPILMKTDIISLLEQQAATSPVGDGLPVIGLWSPACHKVMFFTLAATDQFSTHYDNQTRARFECLGDSCPACSAGLRPTEHLYIPVWNVETGTIAILYFHLGPGGPAQQILQYLKTYQNQLSDVVAVIDCHGQGKVSISAHELLPETDRGAIACQEFCAGLESGAVDIRSCVRKLSKEAIAALPEVKRKSKPLVGTVVPPKSQEG